eukprot:scaffold5092_cov61-Cylindrotheca_fusiformis.AAC.5
MAMVGAGRKKEKKKCIVTQLFERAMFLECFRFVCVLFPDDSNVTQTNRVDAMLCPPYYAKSSKASQLVCVCIVIPKTWPLSCLAPLVTTAQPPSEGTCTS